MPPTITLELPKTLFKDPFELPKALWFYKEYCTKFQKYRVRVFNNYRFAANAALVWFLIPISARIIHHLMKRGVKIVECSLNICEQRGNMKAQGRDRERDGEESEIERSHKH